MKQLIALVVSSSLLCSQAALAQRDGDDYNSLSTRFDQNWHLGASIGTGLAAGAISGLQDESVGRQGYLIRFTR